ncbi:hypothetical protein ADL30_16085 [Streptomyces sp. NRRL S-1521]|nr:hypothetical protein ADL30_16085 [Streptomyces sp. NRRL S-1521]
MQGTGVEPHPRGGPGDRPARGQTADDLGDERVGRRGGGGALHGDGLQRGHGVARGRHPPGESADLGRPPQVGQLHPLVPQFMGGDAEEGGGGAGVEADAGVAAVGLRGVGDVGAGVGARDEEPPLLPQEVHAAVREHGADGVAAAGGRGAGPQDRAGQPGGPLVVERGMLVGHATQATPPRPRCSWGLTP